MKRLIQAALLIAGTFAFYQVAMTAEGSKLPDLRTRAMTPEERAVEAYNNGIGHRDKGNKAEQQLAAASKESDRPKLQKKASDEYDKALKDFTRAAQLNPKLYQAYNGMGFAYRKLGDYAKALMFYDRALEIAPGFPEAIEYRGEAYLGLNRIEESKKAYLELLGADRKQAAILMAAMKQWIEKRRGDSVVDPATLSAFETWISERSETAWLTASMGIERHTRGW